MIDPPTPDEILAAVARLLRETIAAELPPHSAFHARVAANAIDLVRRELELGDRARDEARQRLQALLGRDGSLAELDAELARRIHARELDSGSPGLIEHLMATTLAKMAIDQPGYANYQRALASRASADTPPE